MSGYTKKNLKQDVEDSAPKFDMPDEKRAALVEAGRLAMQLYLDAPAGLLLPTKGAPGAPAQSAADQIATRLLQ